MENRILTLLLFIIGTACIAESKLVQGTGEWTHGVDLESENGIRVNWKNTPHEDNNGTRWLIMEVFAKTKGYVGVGFSPHGGMAGADIVIGWVDSSGAAHLKDFHALANEKPILDVSQDYELLKAFEDDNGTTIRFRRKWETCDEKDMSIVNDTMRFIWAHSPFDPTLEGDMVSNLQWHGTHSRGAVSTFIVDDPFATKFPDDDDPHVNHWDMVMSDNHVEAEHTTYFCKIVKVPEIMSKKKHQMIGYKPILTPGNEKNIHHIVFYECYIPPEYGNTASVFEKHLDNEGGRCYTPNMPPEWTKHCVTFLFVWVAGSEGEMLPDHVGSPLGEEHGGASYFMLEIHYDNPELKTFKDSSGVRIYYTDELRPNDGSVLLMGYRITPFLLLPPSQEKFETYGICSSECTEKAIPKDGINVIITLVHAHLSGRKIRLRHFRGGNELPKIAQDDHYDFNFQQSRSLRNEIKILPGDELMVECEYETKDNDRIVLGGLSTRQEMCQTFFMYYPRINLMQCTSQYEFHDFFKGLGIDKVSGSVLDSIKMPYNPNLLSPEEQAFDPADNAKELEESGDGASFTSVFDHIMIESPNQWKGVSVGKYLKMVNWTYDKNAFGREVESKWKNGKHYAFCTEGGRKRVPLQDYIIPFPEVKNPLQKPNSACQDDQSSVRYSEPERSQLKVKNDKNQGRLLGSSADTNKKVWNTNAVSVLSLMSVLFFR